MSTAQKMKWCDMTTADKKKERTRIEKAVKRAKEAYSNSQSQRIKRAMADGRENNHEDHVMDAAMWLVAHRGKLLPPHYVEHPVVMSLRDGDSTFYHKLASAMKSLEKDGGFVITKPVDARLFMAANWDRWEYREAGRKTKVVVRLAEIFEATGKRISESRYRKIIEQVGLKTA